MNALFDDELRSETTVTFGNLLFFHLVKKKNKWTLRSNAAHDASEFTEPGLSTARSAAAGFLLLFRTKLWFRKDVGRSWGDFYDCL